MDKNKFEEEINILSSKSNTDVPQILHNNTWIPPGTKSPTSQEKTNVEVTGLPTQTTASETEGQSIGTSEPKVPPTTNTCKLPAKRASSESTKTSLQEPPSKKLCPDVPQISDLPQETISPVYKIYQNKFKCTKCNSIFDTKGLVLAHDLLIHTKNNAKLIDPNNIVNKEGCTIILEPAINKRKQSFKIREENLQIVAKTCTKNIGTKSSKSKVNKNSQTIDKSNSKPKIYHCNYCKKLFKCIESCSKHTLNCSKKQCISSKKVNKYLNVPVYYECSYCLQKIMCSNIEYKIHLKECRIKTLTCKICQQLFSAKFLFDKHLFVCNKTNVNIGSFEAIFIPGTANNNSNIIFQEVNDMYCKNNSEIEIMPESIESSSVQQATNTNCSNDTYYYTCKICNSKYASEISLRQHIKLIHNLNSESIHVQKSIEKNIIRYLICEFCEQIFENNRSLQNHIKIAHAKSKSIPETISCNNQSMEKEVEAFNIESNDFVDDTTLTVRELEILNKIDEALENNEKEYKKSYEKYIKEYKYTSIVSKLILNCEKLKELNETKNNSKVYYFCSYCLKIVNSKKLIKEHLGYNTLSMESEVFNLYKIKLYIKNCIKCAICYKPCKDLISYFHHIISCLKSDSVCCNECNESFQFICQLNRHQQLKNHINYGLACKYCEIGFYNLYNYLEHRILCNELFNNYEEMNSNETNNIVYCPKCTQYFESMKLLEIHYNCYHSQNKNSSSIDLNTDKNSKTNVPDNNVENVNSKETEPKNSEIQSKFEKSKNKILSTKIEDEITCIKTIEFTAKQFNCSKCNINYNNKLELQEHFIVVHKSEPKIIKYKCKNCLLQFNTSQNLISHVNNTHIKIKNQITKAEKSLTSLQCYICKKLLRSQILLKNHYLKAHRILINIKNVKTCNICLLNFEDNTLWQDHVVKYHSKLYKKLSENYYKKHVEITRNKFQCLICSKQLGNVSMLKSHITVHNSELTSCINTSLPCLYCNCHFNTKYELYYHIKNIHKACKICNIFFDDESKLNSHINDHNNDKIGFYCCPYCKLMFSLINNVDKHIISKHDVNHTTLPIEKYVKISRKFATDLSEDNKMLCIYCDSTYINENNLIEHMVRFHHIMICIYCNCKYVPNNVLSKNFIKDNAVLYCQACEEKYMTYTVM